MNENKRFNLIKKLILDFENGILNTDLAISEINKISTGNIDEFCLKTYWSAEDIDDFVKRISVEPIENWEKIGDSQALEMIKETIDNISDSGLLRKNSEALEKRYRKSDGTLLGLICNSNMNAEKILTELKKDNVVYL